MLKCHGTSKKDHIFQPDYYIMLHQHVHYDLIEYNNNLIHTFREIPVDIKNMIANKC